MSHALRPTTKLKILHSLTSSSSSILRSDGKWVSRISPKDPLRVPDHHEDVLCLFIDGRKDQQHTKCESELVSALKSCSSLLAAAEGEQLHTFALKSGLNNSNIYVRNSLINLYVKCGRIEEARSMFDSCLVLDSASWNILIGGYVKLGRLGNARQLFDAMPDRDCVSFTTMIMGLAQNGHFSEALEVFKEMRVVGVAPNEVTLASVMSAYSHLDGIHNGSMLHAVVIKAGVDMFTLVSTNLILAYSVSSKLGDAKSIFDGMREQNIVTWNVMLNGYAKAGLADLARDLFEKIPVRDLVSWSTMIDGYVRENRFVEALVMYREMVRSGLKPNEVTMVDLVSACGRLMTIHEGQQLHCLTIKTGLDCYFFMQATIIHFYSACNKMDQACLQFELGCRENISLWNALVAGFVRNNMVDLARQVFNSMSDRDVVSWSSMISGYAQIGQSDSALQLFHEMLVSGVQPNQITMVSILSGVANSGSLKQGKWVHDYILEKSIPLNDNLTAALIDMYAKRGSINSAFDYFSQIRDKASSVSPWNAIICGLAMHGQADSSLRVFSDMQRTHIRPNSITFIGVLTACCHAGLVESGEGYFKSMKRDYNIEPNIKHYGCLLDLLGRAGRLEEAEKLIERMPMKADVVIWGTLLAACRTHGNMEIGERAAASLARLEPDHGAGRILLSNIYADAGRWNDVFSVRNEMQQQRVKKLPGCSGVA